MGYICPIYLGIDKTFLSMMVLKYIIVKIIIDVNIDTMSMIALTYKEDSGVRSPHRTDIFTDKAQVAEFLGVSVKTLSRWISEGWVMQPVMRSIQGEIYYVCLSVLIKEHKSRRGKSQ